MQLFDTEGWKQSASIELEARYETAHWVPDGKTLMLSPAAVEALLFYDAVSSAVRKVATHAPAGGSSLSPDGQHFTVAVRPATKDWNLGGSSIALMRVTDGQIANKILPNVVGIERVFWQPQLDGSMCWFERNSIRLHDRQASKWRVVMEAPPTARTVAWSPRGEWIATAGNPSRPDAPGIVYQKPSDNSIRLRNAASGKPVRALTGHSRQVYCLAWDANGEYLASGRNDNAGFLWNIKTG